MPSMFTAAQEQVGLIGDVSLQHILHMNAVVCAVAYDTALILQRNHGLQGRYLSGAGPAGWPSDETEAGSPICCLTAVSAPFLSCTPHPPYPCHLRIAHRACAGCWSHKTCRPGINQHDDAFAAIATPLGLHLPALAGYPHSWVALIAGIRWLRPCNGADMIGHLHSLAPHRQLPRRPHLGFHGKLHGGRPGEHLGPLRAGERALAVDWRVWGRQRLFAPAAAHPATSQGCACPGADFHEHWYGNRLCKKTGRGSRSSSRKVNQVLIFLDIIHSQMVST